MKHQLWQLNSSLLIIFILVFGVSLLIRQKPPSIQIRPVLPAKITEELEIQLPSEKNIISIYKNDLFDTYTEAEKPKEKLISEIPEPQLPPSTKAEPIKTPEPIPPLEISLKGIMFSTEPQKSAAFIADETQKEEKYHIGNQIKDSQIIKITKNKVVILRNNGQQETLFLRKEDNLLNLPVEKRWTDIIKKIDDENYEVDPIRFKNQINTLGQFLEIFTPATTYIKGKPFGVQISKFNKEEIGPHLGLKENDIIVSINDNNLSTPKERYQVFKEIKSLNIDDKITVKLKRLEQDTTINYNLKLLEKTPNNYFEDAKAQDEKKGIFKLSKEQQKAEQQRKFNQMHPKDREKLLWNMRQRMLRNMRAREKNMRFR